MKRLVAIVRIIIIATGLVSTMMEASAPSIDQKAVAPARKISAMDRLLKFSTVKNYFTQSKPEQKFVMPRLEYNNRVNSLLLLPKGESFKNVQAYNLSSDKKLLFIETTGSGLKSRVLAYAPKKIIPAQFIPEISVTNIIDTQSGKQIATFDDVITYKFSPDQTMLLILSAVQKTVLKTKYAETLQCNLIDTASKSVVKTLDNIQAVDFTPDNKLVVRYGNSATEKIDVKEIKPISTFRKLLNYVAPRFFAPKKVTEILSLQDQQLLQKIKYDLPSRTLTVVPVPPSQPMSWPKITSYYISPDSQFILAKSQSLFRVPGGVKDVVQLAIDKGVEKLTGEKNTIEFLSMETGKLLQEFPNVISYEFNLTDQAPPRLLIFNIDNDTKKPSYQLIDSEGYAIKTFENIAAAYFDFMGNLVVIDQRGKTTLYDAIKGITSEEKDQSQQREQERQRRNESEEYMTTSERKDRQQQIEENREKKQQELYAGLPEKLQKDLEEESRRRQYKEKIQQEFLYPNLQQTHRKLLQQQKENEEQMWGKQPEIKQDANMAAYLDFFQRHQAKEAEARQKEEVQMLEKPKVSEQKKEVKTILSEEEPTLSKEEIRELTEDYERSTAPAQGVTFEKYLQLYKEKKAESLKQRKENQEKEVSQSVKVQMPQVLPKISPQQPKRVQEIQELMNEYVKVQAELPEGINSPEDMDKSIEINKKLESIVTKIIDNFVQSSNNERLALFSTYNNYHQNFTQEQKRKFSQQFFGSPDSSLGTKEETYSIYSSDYTYGAQRFKNKREIKLWMETDGKISSTIIPNKPKEFSNIIGFRFITTISGDVYLFFVDQNYNMGILDVRGVLGKLQKSQELPKTQEPLVLLPAQEPQKLSEAQRQPEKTQMTMEGLKEENPEEELPKIQESLVLQSAQEPQKLSEAQKQPEKTQMTMEGLKEENPEEELPKIQEPLVLQSAQELQKLLETQKQPENIQTTMQDLMNAFATVHKELPQGLASLEDIDKAAEINAQLESIVAKIAEELRMGTEREQSDFLERYNKFTGMEKLKFSKLFFASKGASFGANEQTYTIYSRDVTYRADRVGNERGIELWVTPRSGQGWSSVGKIVPNEPKEFSNIIGFRFITGKPLYSLFFVDQNYDIGVINVATEVDKLKKAEKGI